MAYRIRSAVTRGVAKIYEPVHGWYIDWFSTSGTARMAIRVSGMLMRNLLNQAS